MKEYKVLFKQIYKKLFVALLLLFLIVVTLFGKNKQSGNSGIGVKSELVIVLVLIAGLLIWGLYIISEIIKHLTSNKRLASVHFFLLAIIAGLFYLIMYLDHY